MKPESEMSKGKNHPIDREPPTFEYDPAKTRNKQEGQGEGGFG